MCELNVSALNLNNIAAVGMKVKDTSGLRAMGLVPTVSLQPKHSESIELPSQVDAFAVASNGFNT